MIITPSTPPERLKRMLEYRRQKIPEIAEFERLFPNYLCEFKSESHHSENERNWEFIAGLYKRYLFCMNIDIVFAKIDPESDEIVKEGSHENPTFSLWEVSRIYAPFVLFEPRHVQVYRTQIKTFTTLEWKQLVDANGDFSVLGVPLTKDNHIGDFNLAFRNNDYDELAPPRQ